MSARRFKPYPAYKDSRVEWLGEIPMHWEVKRLKFAAPARMSKLDAKPEDKVYIGLEHVESWTGRLLLDNQPEAVDSVVGAFDAGDVLFGKLRPYLAKAARPEFGGVCTSEILALRPDSAFSQSYVMYCLLNPPYIRWLDLLTYGTKMPRVSPEQVGNSIIPVPPPDEQHAIALFLDRETARIDALVAKKERLIDLLQEKRAALITRAVTKGLPAAAAAQAGLDPNVPMKASGVAWLGEIPAHWEMRPLKRCVAFLEGPGIMAADFTDDGIPLLRIAGIGTRTATLDGCNYLSPDLVRLRWGHFRVRSGDLLISGSASTGFCSEVDQETEGAVPYTGIIFIRPRGGTTEKRYLQWFFLSRSFLAQTELAQSGTAIQHFGPSHLSRMSMVVPPTSEQLLTAAFLEQETTKVDALVAKVRHAIDRLKELRTALISAAVTGKIDVREEAA
jgi:type I restriction enzyme S subunit